MLKKSFILFFIAMNLLFAASTKDVDVESELDKLSVNVEQKSELSPKNTLYIETKDGIIIAELYPKIAPKHVQRIRDLAKENFYDGIVFHRVIKDFMAQTGDPTGTGRGGSPYGRLKAEFNNEKHVRGTLSMARGSDKDTANSQFFIVTGKNGFPELDGQYTIFGKVISGMEFVDKIKIGVSQNNGMVENPDKMLKVITGDMLNNKSFDVVEKEMVIISQLQKDKVAEDKTYKKQPILSLLLEVKDIDITTDEQEEVVEEVKTAKKPTKTNGTLENVKNTAGAVADVIAESDTIRSAKDSFKDITGDTFGKIANKAEEAKEDVEMRKKEKELQKKVKNRVGGN
ncbi:MAG: hypothetical protein Ta2D_07360 [Rickettsiales bacterium]|nr:MAG: hypothetical protein Ta2D_07360 [Rickettsiales bacterium]